MKVDKIARLFLAHSGPAPSAQENAPAVTQSENSDSEAVTVNAGLGRGTTVAASDDASHQAKLARITEAVNSKTYKPDLNAVAAAVYKDLFV